MAEAVRRDLRERLTRVLDDDRRCALGRLLAHDCRRALLERLFDIFVAVGLEAGDRDKQCSGRYLPGVILNAGNIQCFVRVQFQHVKAVQQFFELHSVLLSRMRLWKRILL